MDKSTQLAGARAASGGLAGWAPPRSRPGFRRRSPVCGPVTSPAALGPVVPGGPSWALWGAEQPRETVFLNPVTARAAHGWHADRVSGRRGGDSGRGGHLVYTT